MTNFIFEETSIAQLSNSEKRKSLSNAVMQTKIQAEMNKLDNEENELNSRNIFSKLLGKIDGSTFCKNENINFKRYVLNDKLSRFSNSKSEININNLLADIELFMEDNKDNDIIKSEIAQLNNINTCICNNFDIDEKEVNNFIVNRKQSFLPVLTRKLTKYEQLKFESIKYLNKQGYNK